MKGWIKMTKFEQKIENFVNEYKRKYDKKPYLYEIVLGIESNDKSVVRGINRIYKNYPSKLMVTVRSKELFDQFEEGFTLVDLANKVGVTYEVVLRHAHGMQLLGAKIKPIRNKNTPHTFKKIERYRANDPSKKRRDEERIVGVKVIHGVFEGMLGYLDENLDVVLRIDGKVTKVKMESFDYKEL